MGHHYYDDYRHESAPAEPEPVRLWAETWVEIPSWEGCHIAPAPGRERWCILSWQLPGEPFRFQYALVYNADLAALLWP